jgi:pSer/pThr/pTyr-binding forkhead associated (FHA) protein
MAKLVLSFGDKIIKEYELERGSITIGRDEENDIHIDNPAASNRHAKILTILDESFIEDLDSTNGTYINGKKITGHSLKDGDSIFIGEHELDYINSTQQTDKN